VQTATYDSNLYSTLESLPSMLSPFLRGLQASTGYVFTVIAGGPNLEEPGQLSILEFVAS
jgi:hypothetical protein